MAHIPVSVFNWNKKVNVSFCQFRAPFLQTAAQLLDFFLLLKSDQRSSIRHRICFARFISLARSLSLVQIWTTLCTQKAYRTESFLPPSRPVLELPVMSGIETGMELEVFGTVFVPIPCVPADTERDWWRWFMYHVLLENTKISCGFSTLSLSLCSIFS